MEKMGIMRTFGSRKLVSQMLRSPNRVEGKRMLYLAEVLLKIINWRNLKKLHALLFFLRITTSNLLASSKMAAET